MSIVNGCAPSVWLLVLDGAGLFTGQSFCCTVKTTRGRRAEKGQTSSAPALLKRQEIHLWELMLLPSPNEQLQGYCWMSLTVCQEEWTMSSAGTHQHPPPMGGEDVCLILSVENDSICAKPSGKAPRYPRRQQGRSERSVQQHWRTKKHRPCPLQPEPQMPSSTNRSMVLSWRMPESKTVLGSGKWSAAGYLRSLRMFCFLFPAIGDGAGAEKLLPGVKLFPPFMLNRSHFS